jgi:polar amino acid transport system substrate-binding protein
MPRSSASILLRNIVWAWLLGAFFSFAVHAESLNVYAGQGQMPFAGGTPGSPEGLFTDLMRELCQRIPRECSFRSVPWRRVLYAVNADEQSVVLNLRRNPAREKAYHWLLEVLPSAYVLVSLKQPFNSLADALAAGPVAVMAGTPRADELNAQRQQDQRVVEVSDPKQAVFLLQAGRVVAWYESSLRAVFLWKQLGSSLPLCFGAERDPGQSYIAASIHLKGAVRLGQQMRQAFASMQRDGSWQQLLNRYFGADTSSRLLLKRKTAPVPGTLLQRPGFSGECLVWEARWPEAYLQWTHPLPVTLLSAGHGRVAP